MHRGYMYAVFYIRFLLRKNKWWISKIFEKIIEFFILKNKKIKFRFNDKLSDSNHLQMLRRKLGL
jgi:hypothetical protein